MKDTQINSSSRYTCVLEKDGGILLPQKAVAAYQVYNDELCMCIYFNPLPPLPSLFLFLLHLPLFLLPSFPPSFSSSSPSPLPFPLFLLTSTLLSFLLPLPPPSFFVLSSFSPLFLSSFLSLFLLTSSSSSLLPLSPSSLLFLLPLLLFTPPFSSLFSISRNYF